VTLLTIAEFLWSLRRDGFSISTPQSIDAVRVVELCGVDNRDRLRSALAAVLSTTQAEHERFKACFDLFFAADRGHPGDLFDRLRGRGFQSSEIAALSDVLFAVAERSGQTGDGEGLRILTSSPFELDHLLRAARIKRVTRGLTGPTMVGFFAERVARELGLDRAASALGRIAQVLEEALGIERGKAMAAALGEELDAMRRRLRLELLRPLERAHESTGPKRGALDVVFGELSADEARDVRRAVKDLAAQLRGALRARQRRAKLGRIDPGRTARAAMKTGGVALTLVRRRRRDDKPKLVVLCDLSESVRSASRYMLEFVAVTNELFESTRSFVFVADLLETTSLFDAHSSDRALRTLASGALLNLAKSSNYARVFQEAELALLPVINQRTTVVVLGDGRTNHLGDGADSLQRIRKSARALVWICPEAPSSWAVGDSYMRRYAELSSSVVVARTARELGSALRGLVKSA